MDGKWGVAVGRDVVEGEGNIKQTCGTNSSIQENMGVI